MEDLVPPLLLILRTSTLPIPLRASAITVLATALETAPAAIAPLAETLTEACVTLLSIETESLARRKATATTGRAVPTSGPAQPTKPSSSRVLIEEVDDAAEEAPDVVDEETQSATADSEPTHRRPEEMPDPTTTTSKHPTLRRAAAVFLAALVRTTIRLQNEQLEAAQQRAWRSAEARLDGQGVDIRMPFRSGSDSGGFLLRPRTLQTSAADRQSGYISAEQLLRARTVLRYVSETDVDALVREQASQILAELDQA